MLTGTMMCMYILELRKTEDNGSLRGGGITQGKWAEMDGKWGLDGKWWMAKLTNKNFSKLLSVS